MDHSMHSISIKGDPAGAFPMRPWRLIVASLKERWMVCLHRFALARGKVDQSSVLYLFLQQGHTSITPRWSFSLIEEKDGWHTCHNPLASRKDQ